MNCGNNIEFSSGQWKFNDDNVVETFDEHIRMSIPFYENIHSEMVEMILKMNGGNPSGVRVLDIGCSLGTFDFSLAEEWKDAVQNSLTIDAIDISEKMIEKCIDEDIEKGYNINFLCMDSLEYLKGFSGEYDVVVCTYLFQFLSYEYRVELLGEIHRCLNNTGMFLFADKFRNPISTLEYVNEMELLKYKVSSGFTLEEVKGKMESLKGVQNRMVDRDFFDMLRRCGFRDVYTLCKNWNFESYLILKREMVDLGYGW